MNGTKPSKNSEPNTPDTRQQLIDDGDVLGLLAWMRSRSVLRLPPSAMDDLAKAIRSLERQDVGKLVEFAFGEIIGLVTVLLVRYQLHIERRLAESDGNGGSPGHMPHDLLDEDWVGRVERTTRFLMELTSTRERVRHVARLNDDATKNTSKTAWQHGSSVDEYSGAARNGQKASRNGRVRCPESRIVFP